VERDQLAVWSRGSSSLANHARIVLRCAEPGVVFERLTADLGVTTVTVAMWRDWFPEVRLDGLVDGARSGRPKAGLVLSDVEREQLAWSRRRRNTSQALASHCGAEHARGSHQ
jgi:hypothetical protein